MPMLPSSPPSLSAPAGGGSPLYHVGISDVLHLFYLFIRIRPRSRFFLTQDSSQHPSQGGGQGCSCPAPCRRGTALAGGISSAHRDRQSDLLLLRSIFKTRNIFFHLENPLLKRIAYFRAMRELFERLLIFWPSLSYVKSTAVLLYIYSVFPMTTQSSEQRERELQPVGKLSFPRRTQLFDQP